MENKRKAIIGVMKANGLRITTQRRLIAQLFSVSTGFVLPRQIHAYISKQMPGVSYDTVYRNLRLLVDLHVIEQFDFPEGVHFKLRCGPDYPHHHFICMTCHKTYPLEFCPVEKGIDLPNNFTVVSNKIEVYGLCEDCGPSSKREARKQTHS